MHQTFIFLGVLTFFGSDWRRGGAEHFERHGHGNAILATNVEKYIGFTIDAEVLPDSRLTPPRVPATSTPRPPDN